VPTLNVISFNTIKFYVQPTKFIYVF
jgi:hypothetical protein